MMPKAVQFVKWILYLKVLVLLLGLILGLYITYNVETLTPFLKWIQDTYFNDFAINSDNGVVYNLSILSSELFLPAIFAFMQLLLLTERRSYVVLLILVFLSFILFISRGQVPILNVILLALLSQQSVRNYFIEGQELRKQKRADILDDF